MKIVFYFLLMANLVVAALGWLDLRKVDWQPVYQVPEGVSKLILLTDSQDGSRSSSGEECWLIGPFTDKDEADRVRSDLRYVDYRVMLVEKDIQKAPGYWVYFGPLANNLEARNQLKEFKEKGIDSFIIARPELSNAISLGVFENIDSAKRMIQLMKGRGYDSKMTEISKTDSQFWLSLTVPVSERLQAAFEQFLSGQKERVEARQIFCK